MAASRRSLRVVCGHRAAKAESKALRFGPVSRRVGIIAEDSDGIVQNPPQDTANKLRTVPLWGLRMHPRRMHDLRPLSLESAIERQGGEAAHVRDRFRELRPTDKQALVTFLNSL